MFLISDEEKNLKKFKEKVGKASQKLEEDIEAHKKEICNMFDDLKI